MKTEDLKIGKSVSYIFRAVVPYKTTGIGHGKVVSFDNDTVCLVDSVGDQYLHFVPMHEVFDAQHQAEMFIKNEE